jgi:ubiquitin C-terminal hydrolase
MNSRDIQKIYKDKGLVGLDNIGNTCYMNSIIQALRHTMSLTVFFDNIENVIRVDGHSMSFSKYINKLEIKSDRDVLIAWYILNRKLWSTSKPSINPMKFKHALSTIWMDSIGCNQHDAQECLIKIIDHFHEKLKDDQDISIISASFGFKVQTNVTCPKCSYISKPDHMYYQLSLPIPMSPTELTLEILFHRFFSCDTLDDENLYSCDGCKQQVNASTHLLPISYPRILITHLKRFTNVGKKITTLIKFPLDKLEFGLYTYQLYAVVNHTGSCGGGHYYAFCRNPNLKWYVFNDASVSEIPTSAIVSPNAYILFYRRQGLVLKTP